MLLTSHKTQKSYPPWTITPYDGRKTERITGGSTVKLFFDFQHFHPHHVLGYEKLVLLNLFSDN